RAAGGNLRGRPEGFGKAHLNILVEDLIAQQDDEMLVPGIEEFLLERLVDCVTQIDAEDFCAERSRDLPDGDARLSLARAVSRWLHRPLLAWHCHGRCPAASHIAKLRPLMRAPHHRTRLGNHGMLPPSVGANWEEESQCCAYGMHNGPR